MSIRDAKGNLHSEKTGQFVSPNDAVTVLKPIGAYEFNRVYTKHHIQHMHEMGFIHEAAYEKAAVAFFNRDRGKLYFSHARKRYYRYDEKTGELAVSSDGLIHTYMKMTRNKFKQAIVQDDLEELSYERIGGMPYLRNEI